MCVCVFTGKHIIHYHGVYVNSRSPGLLLTKQVNGTLK